MIHNESLGFDIVGECSTLCNLHVSEALFNIDTQEAWERLFNRLLRGST